MFLAALMNLIGTHHVHTTAYHPAANAMVERLHRQIKASLIAHDSRDHWATYLPYVLLGIRSASKSNLEYTPAEQAFGASLRLPGGYLGVSSASISPASDSINGLRDFFQQL